MAFERNDIVNKTRLMGELGEELMGFEHNDIVTVDVMNKAIEEGGGGGGDFTTAKVTITPSEGAAFIGNGAYSMSDASIPPVSGVDCSSGSIYVEEETTLDIILYKGSAYVSVTTPVSSALVTVTGGIEAVPHIVPSQVGGFFVTGDGTITITEE